METYFIIFVLVTGMITFQSACKANPLVNAPIGKYQGTTLTSRLGRKIFAFRGMRYAKPPVGDLRFQPPVPVDKFDGIYNATVDGAVCPQPSDDPVSEDCLVINVYTSELPTKASNPKRPVIFYIHPGGFYSVTGASQWNGPQYFLDQDIVLVTINYRIASLGFLSTGTKEAPGNNGLKDQNMALRWVQQNIAAFGGDPSSVTLLGYSAGAFSVMLHMLSPMSRNLFHKAAAMSGSAFGEYVLPDSQLHLAKKQARFVGCPEDTPANIISCLKTKPVSDFANTIDNFFEFIGDPVYIWYPVVEKDFGQERFLTDHPAKLVKNGQFAQIPFITGTNKNEFDQRAFFIYENRTILEDFDKNFEKIWPITFLYERNTDKSKNISQTLRKAFIGDGPIRNSSMRGIEELYSDSLMGFPINTAVKLFADKNTKPVYYYHFIYQGRYSHFYIPGTTTPNGVAHHDDLIYLFYISKLFPFFKLNDPESKMVDTLTSIYANFAKTGYPIPRHLKKFKDVKWEPFTLESQKYLEIGDGFEIKEKLNEARYSVWRKLFPISEM